MNIYKTITTLTLATALTLTTIVPSYAQVSSDSIKLYDDVETRPYVDDDSSQANSSDPGAISAPTAGPEDTSIPADSCYNLSTSEMKLGPGQSETLSINDVVTGEAVSISFISDDTGVATVDVNGKVRGEAPGNTIVRATLIIDGQTAAELQCSVTVSKKNASYSKLRKKLKKLKDSNMEFKDEGNSNSALTLYLFYYNAFKVHPGDKSYGSGDETIIMRPAIKAKKDGGSSSVSIGINLQSFVEIRSYTSRNYKSMTIRGGGEKIKLTGSTSCRHKTIGSYIRWQVITKGFFKISDDKKLHLDRLDKLKRILSSKKPNITVKDSSVGKKYKCKLTEGGIDSLKKLIRKYRKAIKIYW